MMDARKTLEWMKAHGQDVRNPSGGPSKFRLGLASKFGCMPEDVDALIAEVWGDSKRMHPEDAAQAVLAAERKARREDPDAARAYDHEED